MQQCSDDSVHTCRMGKILQLMLWSSVSNSDGILVRNLSLWAMTVLVLEGWRGIWKLRQPSLNYDGVSHEMDVLPDYLLVLWSSFNNLCWFMLLCKLNFALYCSSLMPVLVFALIACFPFWDSEPILPIILIQVVYPVLATNLTGIKPFLDTEWPRPRPIRISIGN
jgi:hypothetical protein